MTEPEVDTAVDSDTANDDGADERKFPKIVNAAEDASIVHYSPEAHEPLDPSKRHI